MKQKPASLKTRIGVAPLLVLAAWFCLTGCSHVNYYLDVLNGHANLLNQQRPLDEVLQDPNLDTKKRAMLTNLKLAREFASEELFLPDNDSYRYYADINRQYAVWNVIATPPLSVQPRQWCYLFVGCMCYRGFFSETEAERYAADLQAQGLDVYVAGVSAYSTLGWMEDPLLSTMLHPSEARRVGLVFHELAHQVVYRRNDTTFNESFATVVEQEGLRRWFKKTSQPEAFETYLMHQQRDEQFRLLLLETRRRLEEIYAANTSKSIKLNQKQTQFEQLRQDYAQWKKTRDDYAGYDTWMAQDLNNAHLALIATYHKLIPFFEKVLDEEEHDLRRFYAKVKRLSVLSDDELNRYRCMMMPEPACF